MMRTPACDRFGIDVPIFAFSHSRAVVAEVSKAGGLGVLGALAFSPEELEQELTWIEQHVDGRPFGVDIVVPASSVAADGVDLESMIPSGHRRFVEELLGRYHVPPLAQDDAPTAGLLGWVLDRARAQVDVALSHPVRLLACALGPPPPDVVEAAHSHQALVCALVGTAEQARRQVETGCDVIVAQGTEAGGHTGTVSTFVLVPEVVEAVRPTPVLAAGGIGSGRQAAAALALGAQGVWTGSIWLAVDESDTHPVLIDKLLAASAGDTVRTRAMTGKTARLLRTAWTDAWDAPDSPGALPMPLQFMLTAEALNRMYRSADDPASQAGELITTPAGQIVGSMTERRSVRETVDGFVREFREAVASLNDAAGR